MVTDAGAIYVTNNAAYTWKAAVEETVDATLNRTVSSGISGASYYDGSFSMVSRSPDVSAPNSPASDPAPHDPSE